MLAGVLGGVLLAHAWVLLGWTGRESPALHSAPVLMRLRELPSTPAETPPAPPPAGQAAPPPSPAAVARPPATEALVAAAETRAEGDAAPPPAPAGPTHEALEASEAPPVAAQDVAAIPPVGEGVWHFRLRQAGEEGRAWLQWQSGPDAYALELRRRLPSRALPGWRSEGSRDALGLAPQRFSVLKGAREAQALNFRRQQGLISYSASTTLQPLAPAAQDRLSWWLQLPALLQAWQALHGTPLQGQRFEIPVALIRGGLHRWQFSVLGQEQGLWHLQRGALGPHDNRLDVWLDPARQFLPVRLHQQIGEEEGWEMELLDEPTGPELPAAA